jgi:hypothetical protein
MRGDAMTAEERPAWTDEQLVEHIGKWAIELSTCRLNAVKHNRILDRELFPAQAILAARGAHAVRHLPSMMRLKIHSG